ncbi:hypothetical protein [Luteimonas sp. SDU101]
MRRYVTAWRERNWDDWGQLFEKESDFISWRGWWGRTRDENVALHRATPTAIGTQMVNYSLTTEKVAFLCESIALVHAKWVWREFSEDASPPSDRRGLLTMVLVKGNSDWSIRSLHNSRIIE